VEVLAAPKNEMLGEYLREFKKRRISICDIVDLQGNTGF